jgi:hypothetical protein
MSQAWGAAYGQYLALTRRLEHLEERIAALSPLLDIKKARLERARERVRQRLQDVQAVLQALHV